METGATTDASDGRDPRLEALLDESERLTDWRSTIYGGDLPNPPSSARAHRMPTQGPFATTKVASVRAYLDQNVSDMHHSPFTEDGRLEPSIVPPEAELSANEMQQVMQIVAQAHDDNAVLRCEFEPHHIVVFFDAAGVPLGQLLVCMTCGEWAATPQLPHAHAMLHILTQDERLTLARILDGHGLGAWVFEGWGDSGGLNEEVSRYQGRIYGSRDAPTPAGRERLARRRRRPIPVDEATPAPKASVHDREYLCTWFREELDRNPYGFGWGGHGYRCDSGASYSLLDDTPACEKPMACDVPLGRIESCLRSFMEGPEHICATGPGPDCAGLLGCVPGVKWIAGSWEVQR
jgi:hypothetical protein